MKNILLFTCTLCMLFACAKKNVEYNHTLENFTSPTDTSPTLSELFNEHFCITSLETNAHSLIGRIDKIVKFQNRYYISSDGIAILCFDEDGKFISSLQKIGQGPEEYNRIEDFDVYNINGETELWISDNVSLKIYDTTDFSFKYKITFDYIIHKFKRLPSSNILLVTGLNEYSLTLTDQSGQFITEYLKKEIPFLMFRPVQFINNGTDCIYQLGISNAYVAFNTKEETFREGVFSKDKSFLSDKELVHLFNQYGIDFIKKANKKTYLSNLVSFKDIMWVNTYKDGKNYLSKVETDKVVSTTFSSESVMDNDLFGLKNSSFISTITLGESDDSILLYIDSFTLSKNDNPLYDKNGNHIVVNEDDNPCILEFYF